MPDAGSQLREQKSQAEELRKTFKAFGTQLRQTLDRSPAKKCQAQPTGWERAALLEEIKEAYQDALNGLRVSFEAGGISGLEAASLHSGLMDELTAGLWRWALEFSGRTTQGLALVAVGGYGRDQLAPFSDIDLLFLLRSGTSKRQDEDIVTFLLYWLWDLGFKVGHALRTVEQSIKEARNDQTVSTALLEARFLIGDERLFNRLRRTYDQKIRQKSPGTFINNKLEEREARWERHGGSRYQLEPNIKEGKGGLRDLHSLVWIARFVLGEHRPQALSERGYFSFREAVRLSRAESFLWSVRFHLHFLLGRGEDKLSFDVQPQIAERMGYASRGRDQSAVERFMRHYFWTSKTLGAFSHIFLAALRFDQEHGGSSIPQTKKGRRTKIGGYLVDRGYILHGSEQIFEKDPLALLRLFLASLEEDLLLHPRTMHLITHNQHLAKGLRKNPEANALFLSILTSRNNPAKALRRLSDAGVLGRFIPDYERIIGRMQFDRYHHYTVDEHSLLAIENLWHFENQRVADELPLSCELIHQIEKRDVLYLAVFLHDIGKGRGGNHSILGERVALKLAPRFGFSSEDSQLAGWLVRHHLDLSKVMLRRDLDNPQSIIDFASLVGSVERLRMLHVLTSADIRAVAPSMLTGWKAAMMRKLYRLTEEALVEMGDEDIQEGRSRVLKKWGIRAREKIAAFKRSNEESSTPLPSDLVEDFVTSSDPDFWQAYSGEQHLEYARLFLRFRSQTWEGECPRFALDIHTDHRRRSLLLSVIIANQVGNFSRFAGAIAASGGSIQEAHIHSFTGEVGFLFYSIYPPAGMEECSLERFQARLEQAIEEVFRKGRSVDDLLKERGRLKSRKKTSVLRQATRVRFNNEVSRNCTLVEVKAEDAPAVLFRITRALAEQNLSLHAAKAATYGNNIIDVFYVADRDEKKLVDERKMDSVRTAIVEALDSHGTIYSGAPQSRRG